MVVILGTAHGSNVKGKRSPDGRLLEYRWSREMCYMTKDQLEEIGIKAIIDIEDDIEQSLAKRVNIVNQICKENGGASNCIYVSIHLNAAKADGTWSNASGWTVWIYNKASQNSKRLALNLFDVAEEMDMFGNRYIPETKYFTANFAVLRSTTCPAVLTENLFQDNKKDVDYLLSIEGKEAICKLHVEGIKRHLGIKDI